MESVIFNFSQPKVRKPRPKLLIQKNHKWHFSNAILQANDDCLRKLCGSPPIKAASADVGVFFNSFFPSFLKPGDHPSHIAFYIYNDGFDAVSVNVTLEIFLSRNSVFGDADDVKVGKSLFHWRCLGAAWDKCRSLLFESRSDSDTQALPYQAVRVVRIVRRICD